MRSSLRLLGSVAGLLTLVLTMSGATAVANTPATSTSQSVENEVGTQVTCRLDHAPIRKEAHLKGVGSALWDVYCNDDGTRVYAIGYLHDTSWDGHDACIETPGGVEIAYDSYEHKGSVEFATKQYKGRTLNLVLRSCD